MRRCSPEFDLSYPCGLWLSHPSLERMTNHKLSVGKGFIFLVIPIWSLSVLLIWLRCCATDENSRWYVNQHFYESKLNRIIFLDTLMQIFVLTAGVRLSSRICAARAWLSISWLVGYIVTVTTELDILQLRDSWTACSGANIRYSWATWCSALMLKHSWKQTWLWFVQWSQQIVPKTLGINVFELVI